MREIRYCGLNIALLAGACLLAPYAYKARFYVTTGILILAALGAAATILAMVIWLTRRKTRVETIISCSSDLDTIRNKALLDHAPIALLYQDADGSLHAANRVARRLFSTDDRLSQEQNRIFETHNRIIRFSPSEGVSPHNYSCSTVMTTGTGGIRRLIALTDIETDLNEADARVLRDLLSILSHEIMNSLTPVVSLAETAHDLTSRLDDPQSRDMLKEALDTILRRTRGIDRFVQGYRTLARLPPPERKPTQLKGLLLRLTALFEARWKDRVSLVVSFPPSHSATNLDAEQIEQAVLNLLNNAADAAIENTSNIAPMVWLEAKEADQRAIFTVRDNGDGITQSNRETIFQLFLPLNGKEAVSA